MLKLSKADLIKLLKKYTTDEAIAKKFGVTRQAIHQQRKKYGIKSSYADNPGRNRKIIALYKMGAMEMAPLAKKFGLSISQTCKIINRTGKYPPLT